MKRILTNYMILFLRWKNIRYGKPFDPPQKVDESVAYEMEPIVEALKIAEEDSGKA